MILKKNGLNFIDVSYKFTTNNKIVFTFSKFSKKTDLIKKFIIVSNFSDISILVLKFIVIAYINNYIL